ncbi:hypothetical protein VOLCADRAFT_94502 [Volvox carteri f. nagariensis]|uniref:Uncharacterized protein n=1 Tax=Volvox carteri f. nagariensis TaxID=3068 RepID=D8U4Y9_VOLCA|nr:uncharacterized protein VOLCADRAFT_94502 [Volvox carteri f. nagariensis]EFJ45353.1 hypothetical protein VOLCADRAFT_94502 [Volvox carteri f. nagariensis]|eukprot:XP_002953729.1 hypothetical protein VOLCADRAFT_94502 [Volvox carteri f. nagariensis]
MGGWLLLHSFIPREIDCLSRVKRTNMSDVRVRLLFTSSPGTAVSEARLHAPPPGVMASSSAKPPEEQEALALLCRSVTTTLELRNKSAQLATENAELARKLLEAARTEATCVEKVEAQTKKLALQVRQLETKLKEVSEEKKKLQLEEAEQSKHALEQQLQQLQQQHSYGAHQATADPLQQVAEAMSFAAVTGGVAGRDDNRPAGPMEVDEHQPRVSAPTSPPTAAAAPRPLILPRPLPPVLHLDPAHLLVEADLEVGLTRSDIELELHKFSTNLAHLCHNEQLLNVADQLINLTIEAALPDHAERAIPGDALRAQRPSFLGHMLLYWMTVHLWPDPLSYFGCTPLKLLDSLPVPSGPEERNLLVLLRSHAARRWLPTMRRVVHLVTEAEARRQETSGRCFGRGWYADLEHQSVKDAGVKAVRSSLISMVKALANWLVNFPGIESAVKHDAALHALLLHALQVGLVVQAAHPLLRLYVATPLVEEHRAAHAALDCASQGESRRVRLQPKYTWHGKGKAVGGGVLCSVQPGVRYDIKEAQACGIAVPARSAQRQEGELSGDGVRAGGAAVAGDGGGGSGDPWVLLKEEVVTDPSVCTTPKRRSVADVLGNSCPGRPELRLRFVTTVLLLLLFRFVTTAVWYYRCIFVRRRPFGLLAGSSRRAKVPVLHGPIVVRSQPERIRGSFQLS